VPRASPSRLERLLPAIAGIALALPSLLSRYLPMSDLPIHEGAIGVLLHFGDPTYFPPGMYTLNLGHENQLFYFAAWPLAYALGTDVAVRVVVAATQVLIFTGAARLADHLGRTRWGALLVAPLSVGFTYYWGLVTNLVGFACLLYALPSLDRFAERPTRRGLLGVLGVLGVLFFAHGSAPTIALGVLVLFALLRPLAPRETALRLVAVPIAIALQFVEQARALRAATRGTLTAPLTFHPLGLKLKRLATVLFGAYEPALDLLLLAVAVGAMAALVVSRVAAREAGPAARSSHEGRGWAERARWIRDAAHERRFEVLGALLLLGYFVVPFNFGGATMLYERFLGPSFAILAVCAAPKGPPTRLAKLLAPVVPLTVLLAALPQFVDASLSYRTLDPILAAIPKGSSVTLLSLEPAEEPETRAYSVAIGPARSLAVNGGRTGLSLVISPIAPVQIRPDLRWNDFDRRAVAYGSLDLRPGYDLESWEWVVARSSDKLTRALMREALAPDADLVATSGEWMLFHSRHHVVPVASPERPPPPDDHDTVVDRVRAARARHAGMPAPPPMPLLPPPTR
jgi:hypothetical protein